MTRYFKIDAAPKLPASAGFRSAAQSVHGSRTIMLADLEALLANVAPEAKLSEYEHAIREDNVLGKKTATTRLWAWKKLRELYALDPDVPVFRLMRSYWDLDPAGRPLLAGLAALSRDGLLRATIPVIEQAKPGDRVSPEEIIAAISAERGERFSDTTMKAVVAHVFTSWRQTGHLSGAERLRVRVTTTTATTAYALALGYLAGARGELLFSTMWTRLLDASASVLHDQAREASRLGWLTYRGIGNIVEITFPSVSAQSALPLNE